MHSLKYIHLILLLSLALGCGSEFDEPIAFESKAVSSFQVQNDSELKQKPLRFSTEQEIADGLVISGSYIVAFKQTQARSGLFFSSPRTRARFHTNSLAQLSRRSGVVSKLRYLASLSLSKPGQSFAWQAPRVGARSFLPFQDNLEPNDFQEAHLSMVDFEDENDARETLQLWYRSGLIWYAEPNFNSKHYGQIEKEVIDGFSDGSRFPAYNQIKLIDAMTYLNDDEVKQSPLIAVLDSGIDVNHPALASQVYVNEDGQNRLCRDDIRGCNTTEPEGDFLGNGNAFPAGTSSYGVECSRTLGDCPHGTHVAGLIAGTGSDAFTGVCPYCKILNVRVGTYKGDILVISDAAIIGGLSYISGFQSLGQPVVRVINASFGKYQRSRSVEVFVRALKDFGNGVMVISAAGNENTIRRSYPAAFSDAIAVANIDSSDYRKSSSSNFGVWVDIAGPGDGPCEGGGALESANGLLSAVPGGGLACLVGTSMASPVVAGVAGLALSLEPNLSFSALKERLLKAAEATNIYRGGVNDEYRPIVDGNQSVPLLGSGVVNAMNTLNPSRPKEPSASLGVSERVAGGCESIAASAESRSDHLNHQAGSPLRFWVLVLLVLVGPLAYLLVQRFFATQD